MSGDRRILDRTESQDMLRAARPTLRRLFPALAFGVLSAGSAVALLATSAWLITRASEQPALLYISLAVVGVRAFALARAFFRYLERLAGHDAAFRRLGGLRALIFARLVPLAPDGLGGSRRGDLLAKLVDDVDELQNYPLRVIQPLVTAGVVALASAAGVLLLLPAAGIALTLALILAVVTGAAVDRWAGRAGRSIATLRASVADSVLDLTRSVDVLTAFDAMPTAQQEVERASGRLAEALRSRALGVALTGAIVSVVAGAATIAAIAAGVPALEGHRLDAPTLAVVALLPLAVFETFAMVPLALGTWRQVRASAERIAEVAPSVLPPGIPVDRDGARRWDASHRPVPRVSVTGLTATWPGQDAPVLNDITLELAPGERVLLTGPTGAGKSALAHVFTRLIDYRGRYTIDGIDVAESAQDDVRCIVGLCEQQPYIFDSDLRQNLLFARDTATDDELLAVLERVGLGEWARSRDGLATLLGERGALVSGGQAQRIALARALLADFPVLVVDEPTANVDAGSADRVVRDILTTAVEDGRTVLLISHTPVPGELLTRTVRMEDGRIGPAV